MSLSHPLRIGAAIARAVDELAEVDGNQHGPRQPLEEQPTLDAQETSAVSRWLAEFSRFPGTFDDYFDEAVRLLFWTSHVRGVTVSEMTRKDALAYQIYLSTARRGLSGERQRLAVQVAMGVFGALQDAGQIESSPWSKRMARGATRPRPAERLPNAEQWRTLHAHVEALPQRSLRDRQHRERQRWIIHLFQQTGIRVAEAAHLRINDFQPCRGRWRLRIADNHGHERFLPVGEQLLAELRRYRTFHGVGGVPMAADAGPAIRTITGKWEHFLTPIAIQRLVKSVFMDAAQALQATDPATADGLHTAYACWLRSAGSVRRRSGTATNAG